MERESLGPYRIDRELGSGGMGKVYAATLLRQACGLPAGTTVALKIVHPHLLETEGFFKRFLREAQIGRSVKHDNVVRTFDCDAIGGDHFLVMEYVEGQTLADLQRELDKVPEELCRHVAREICKGLAAIHEAGVVHRDLKPENVLITPDHVVKVMDLGVAQLTEQTIRLSQTGAFVGSVEYAAPEQFGKGEVDHRCDLHALGLLLYELSTGQHPYRADDFRRVMRHVIDDEPRRIGEVNPQLSAYFEEVVHTLLAKSAEDRFADASALLSVLEEGDGSPWWKERANALRAATSRPIRRIRIPRETAVYGRERELDRLRGLYEQAKAGEGQVVLIEGEAGIGKSRLVDELIARLQAGGEDVSFLFGSYPPGGAATAAGGFSSAYREHFGEAGCATHLVQTPLLVPAFDAVLRGEPTPTGVVELTRDSLGTCFVHATRNLAAERPTVVLIDDLHFAPVEARTLFQAVAQAVPGHRVLLLGTMRPGVPEDWIAHVSRLDHASHLALARLGAKDLALLLKDSFRSDELAQALALQIGLKSDGNPFFAFEIIHGLREGQFITQKDDGTWASTRVIDEIQIPSSVLDLVNARVADLAEEERDLLDVACCWGFEFDPALIGDVVGLARIPALKCFGQIERRHRLVRSSGRNYVFDHHQVQEALYGSLNTQLREEYHAALAEALQARTGAAEQDPETLDGALCVDLCEHYLDGARGGSALRYLAAAQAHLRKGYLTAHVVALAERALAVPDLVVGVERAKELLRLAEALDLLGRRDRQEECAREAAHLAEDAGDDIVRAWAMMSLGTLLWRTSRHDEAEAAYRRALDLSRALGDASGETGATGNLGLVAHSRGRLAEARAHCERALVLHREVGNRPGEASATINLGNVAHAEGRFVEARENAARALALIREVGNRRGEAIATGNLGVALCALGCLPEAVSRFERSLALSREIGDRESESRATVNLGNVLQRLGRFAEAKAHHERAIALCREIGHRDGEAVALVNLGPAWLKLGELERARRALEASIALSRTSGARYPEGYGLLDLGRLADVEGDAALARTLVEQSLALRRAIGHGDGIADSLIELGELLSRMGQAGAARSALEEALALSRQHGRQPQAARTLCLLATLPGGDLDAARAALADASEDSELHELHLHLWRTAHETAHLVEAKRLLDELLAKNPPEHHASMRTNVRVNREILAAWREEFGEEDNDSPGDDTPHATESETRVRPDPPSTT